MRSKLFVLFFVLFIISGGYYLFSPSSEVEEVEIIIKEVEAKKAPIVKIKKEIPKERPVEVATPDTRDFEEKLKRAKEKDQAAKKEEELKDNEDLLERKLSDGEFVALEEYFENLEEEWEKSIEELFIEELQLGESVLEEYWKMQEGLERDKIQAFDEFHKAMQKKFGDDYNFRPSKEQRKVEKELRDRYQDELKTLLGGESYSRYLELMNETNEKIKHEAYGDIPGGPRIEF
jgi:hypothetical protein